MGFEVFRVVSGMFPSNSYICKSDASGTCFVIDPCLDFEAMQDEFERRGCAPKMVFCTHGHFDHIGCSAEIQDKYGCPVYLHEADLKVMKSSNFLMKAFRIPYRIRQPSITAVGEDFKMMIGSELMCFHHTPGHTDGSCVIEFGNALFTGDTVYANGVGLSRLPGENPEQLKESVQSIWSLLTDDRTIFPGHGSSATGSAVRVENRALLKFLGFGL